MSRIIKMLSERKRVKHIEYKREFKLITEKDTGFAFPSDEDGNIILDEHYDCWGKNYEYCLSHSEEYEDLGVIENSWWYTEPAVAKCSCGKEIQLVDQYMGACQCECGQWYNMYGQSLINPEFWEEDY